MKVSSLNDHSEITTSDSGITSVVSSLNGELALVRVYNYEFIMWQLENGRGKGKEEGSR